MNRIFESLSKCIFLCMEKILASRFKKFRKNTEKSKSLCEFLKKAKLHSVMLLDNLKNHLLNKH